MAFTNDEKAQLRRWCGRSPIGIQYDPSFESAIATTETLGDSGSTENAIRAWLTELTNIETQWKTLYPQAQVGRADKASLDVARGVATLKSIGRMYVGHICDALHTKPFRDVFTFPELEAP